MKRAREIVLWISFLVGTTSAFANTVSCQNILSPESVALNPAKGEISYKMYGTPGRPTIVLIHGMGGDLHSYDLVMSAFLEKYRVLVFDQRGHGGTARGEVYTTEALAQDLKVLVDHLGIEKFDLIGHSMGGRVAARFAVMYPDQVQRLVVEDMDLTRRVSADEERQRRAVLKADEVQKRLDKKKYKTKQDLENALAPFFNESDLAGVMEGSYQRRGGWTADDHFAPDVYIKYWSQANKDGDLLQGLAATNIPILLIQADASRFWTAFTDNGVREAQKWLPKAEIVRVHGAPHMIHSTLPHAYLDLVQPFLNKKIEVKKSPGKVI